MDPSYRGEKSAFRLLQLAYDQGNEDDNEPSLAEIDELVKEIHGENGKSFIDVGKVVKRGDMKDWGLLLHMKPEDITEKLVLNAVKKDERALRYVYRVRKYYQGKTETEGKTEPEGKTDQSDSLSESQS